jgi:hypothetical protein
MGIVHTPYIPAVWINEISVAGLQPARVWGTILHHFVYRLLSPAVESPGSGTQSQNLPVQVHLICKVPQIGYRIPDIANRISFKQDNKNRQTILAIKKAPCLLKGASFHV